MSNNGKGITNYQVRYDLVNNYLKTPHERRPKLKEWLRLHRLTSPTFYKLEGKIEAEKDLEEEKRKVALQVQAVLGDAVTVIDPDKEQLDLVRQIQEMDTAVFNAGKIKQVARMAELWYKRKGLIIDKQEHKVEIGLSSEEITRRNLEADKQLKEGGFLSNA